MKLSRSDLRRRRWTENGRAEQRSGRDSFRDWFDERVEELYEQEEPETELFDDWDNLIQSLHIRLKDYSEKAGFRSGTTVEAVLFMKGRYYICHVGDCRTYIISDTLTQLTTDHTIVQRELTEGKLTPEQARKDSRQAPASVRGSGQRRETGLSFR